MSKLEKTNASVQILLWSGPICVNTSRDVIRGCSKRLGLPPHLRPWSLCWALQGRPPPHPDSHARTGLTWTDLQESP